MKKRACMGGFLSSLFVAVVVAAGGSGCALGVGIEQQAKVRRMREIYKGLDTRISFFGKVLDQHNKPIAKALVSYSVQRYSPSLEGYFTVTKRFSCRTDENGLFSVRRVTGRNLAIKNISLDGYDGSGLLRVKRIFNYSVLPKSLKKPFVPDKASPVVFHLRKKGEATFCLEYKRWRYRVNAEGSGQTAGYDFIWNVPVKNLNRPMFNGASLFCDLKVKATLDSKTKEWTVTLSADGPKGGIIVSDQLLFEAPETGYKSKYTFKARDFDARPNLPKVNCIYLKSRDPAIYTRIEISRIKGEPYFKISGDVVTNPYGERNFEAATGLPREVYHQLRAEVKTTFRKGKRPANPDLPALIKAAKNK
jgi:hypothetical protein